MKLLVLSHACITSTNQQFFAEVEQQTGWEIILITPSSWLNDYGLELKPNRWHQFNGQLIEFSLWKSGNIPLHAYRTTFRQILKQIQPDAIYVHHEPYALAAFQMYMANRLSIRKPIGFYSAQNIHKSYPIPFHQIEKFVLRNSSYAFPVSRAVAQVLRNKGYQGKTTVLPLGVDVGIYHNSYDVSNLKKQLKTNSDEVLIGYLGRITSEKGLKTLLQAIKNLENKLCRLIVVGAGGYEDEFRKHIDKLQLSSKVTCIGFVPHVEAPKYLAAFDILVLPSETQPNWKEQFGRVVIESMACGTPVVGSDSGEIPYLIESTQGGLIFPEGNSMALSQQLTTLIEDEALRFKLASQGRQAVIEKYSNSTVVEAFVRTISGVIPELPTRIPVRQTLAR
jgi:L-malate glycosyltransferase